LIDPSILKTERPPVTCARSKSYCGRRNRPTAPPAPPAEAGSFIGTFGRAGVSAIRLLSGHRRGWFDMRNLSAVFDHPACDQAQ